MQGRLFVVSVCLLLSVACMREPGDGEDIGVTANYYAELTPSVTFMGHIQYADTDVTVYAYIPDSNSWQVVGTTKSVSYPETWSGLTGYSWQFSAGIPSEVFGNICGDDLDIRVKALSGPYGGIQTINSLVPDYIGCWGANPSWMAFGANCLGDNSPEAVIKLNRTCPPPQCCLCSINGCFGSCCPDPDPPPPPATCQKPTGQPCTEGPSSPHSSCDYFSVGKVWKCIDGEMDVCDFLPEGAPGSYCRSAWDGSGGPNNPKANCGKVSGSLCEAGECYPGTNCNLTFQGPARCGGDSGRALINPTTGEWLCPIAPCWPVDEKANLCPYDQIL